MRVKTKKLVHGVGANDAGYDVTKYETIECDNGKRKRKQVWMCPYYQTWVDMLKRCYDTKLHECRPTYIGCSVSEEWKTFSNFKSWMEKQDFEGKQLDKDLLIKGNKLYSPDTCVFVSPLVNSFTNDHGASRGEWLIGVNWEKQTEEFRAQCRNPFTKKREYLGLFTNELQAHNAWLKRKLELAHELAAIQEDTRVAKALIARYTNYKTH